MSESAGRASQLDIGSVLRRNETLFIIERGPTRAGDIVVAELGDRDVKVGRMFDVGDPCPVPICDGEVVEGDSARRRRCSEGCLEWLRNYPAEGAGCTSTRCEDGTVLVQDAPDGHYRYGCTECELFAGGVVRWRESWCPYTKDRVLDELDSRDGGEPDVE